LPMENGTVPLNRQDPSAVVTLTRTLLTVASSTVVVALLSVATHRPVRPVPKFSAVTVAPFRHINVAALTQPIAAPLANVPVSCWRVSLWVHATVRVPNGVGALSVCSPVVEAVKVPPPVVMSADAAVAKSENATSAVTVASNDRSILDTMTPVLEMRVPAEGAPQRALQRLRSPAKASVLCAGPLRRL
jgi:hypothetical protein